MKRDKRKYAFYLEDILKSMQRIVEYTSEMDYSGFKRNYMVVDAVVRNFEIIGEASKHIPAGIQKKYPEIPWKKMYGLRNLITHAYFGLDYEILWEIARGNLPENIEELQRIVKEMNSKKATEK